MQIPRDPSAALADHQHAVAEFIAAARAVPADRWGVARHDSKWSPEQIAEHVRLTYDVVSAQFDGGPGLRVRTPWWIRPFLRWRFLPTILESGVFPATARAPREILPGAGPFDREALLAGLEQSAAAMERKLMASWHNPTRPMTHHVFGALDSPKAARLVTVHTMHHAKQLRALD